MSDFNKYPKTIHLKDYEEGLEGKFVVVEEKMDGTQVGISFNLDGTPFIQTRGHRVFGGQFDLLKSWVNVHKAELLELLGTNHVMFGEWMLNKHSIFYDMLPHYFMEYDVLDKKTGSFLSTMERNQMFTGTSVTSVAVLWNGVIDDIQEVHDLMGHSLFKSANWKENLREESESADADIDAVFRDTDSSRLMEGLYIKVEEDGKVTDRIKVIRPDFITAIVASDTHWMDRKPVFNRMRAGVNLWR